MAMIGWLGFLATIVIALIVGSISKVFKETRGGNFFAALVGAQMGVLLVSKLGAGRWIKGIVGILCAILITWLLSLGRGEEKESVETSPPPPEQNP